MKSVLRLAGVLLLAPVSFSVTAHAQVPYTQGAVTRVVLLSIVPGHSDSQSDIVGPPPMTGILATLSPTKTWPLSMAFPTKCTSFA